MRPIVRRTASILVVPALALSTLGVLSSPASAEPDPVPADAGAAWLAGQLTDGIVHNDDYDFDDVALSADVGLALQAVGGHDETVDQIAAAVEPRAEGEWYTSTFDGVTTLYAGSLAKTARFAQATGADATDFGGEDLIAMLEGTVSSTAPTTGRVQDENNDFSDTNTFGQAYAAQALASAGSPSAIPVTGFLLEQQCADGWFRLDFAERDAPEQTCDGDPASVPDTDATATALMAMASMDDVSLAPAIDKAEGWLLSTQRRNGAWGGGPTTEAPNANSTGLAGWALAEVGGNDEAVADAAAWVRGHQATNVASCTDYAAADLGAIAYDNAAIQAVATDPIVAATQDQFRRTTAQALPVLQWAPTGAGEPRALFTAEYVKAGGRKPVGVIDAAPGEALCAVLGEQSVLGYADVDGDADLKVLIPSKTAISRVKVANAGGRFGTVEINALGKSTLHVSLKSRLAKGKKQIVKVTRLAAAEPVTVKVDGRQVANDQANAKGVFATSFKVTGKPRRAKVVVRGAFGTRKASKTFTVVR